MKKKKREVKMLITKKNKKQNENFEKIKWSKNRNKEQ